MYNLNIYFLIIDNTSGFHKLNFDRTYVNIIFFFLKIIENIFLNKKIIKSTDCWVKQNMFNPILDIEYEWIINE